MSIVNQHIWLTPTLAHIHVPSVFLSKIFISIFYIHTSIHPYNTSLLSSFDKKTNLFKIVFSSSHILVHTHVAFAWRPACLSYKVCTIALQIAAGCDFFLIFFSVFCSLQHNVRYTIPLLLFAPARQCAQMCPRAAPGARAEPGRGRKWGLVLCLVLFLCRCSRIHWPREGAAAVGQEVGESSPS